MAIHDLQHRIHPEFPEVSADGEWEAREYLFTNGVRRAEAILVDSEVGREDVLEFYGHLTSPDRVRILPFVPPPYLVQAEADEVSATLRSPRSPRPLPALSRPVLATQEPPSSGGGRRRAPLGGPRRHGAHDRLGERTPPRGACLARSARSSRERESATWCKSSGTSTTRTMAALYAGASGVLLPTFFGPTNIPVIEAWAMGVPVLTSDIRGIREQCGDAAILVDPLSTEAIIEGIRRLWMDDALRRTTRHRPGRSA